MRLGRYELLLPIGSGAMATVHLARTEVVDGVFREVALKVMHPHLRADDKDGARVLVEEAKLVARIRHPNVVRVQEAADEPLGTYIAMDYVEGETLSGLVRAELARGSRVPLPILGRLLVAALSGLHAAHELRDEEGTLLGIVHRDFTPSNILVGIDGVTRLTDFGIAKGWLQTNRTVSGEIKGKVGYMSPEQVRGERLDRRTDVWAAGVVAWECVAGRRLYGAGDDVERLRQITTEVPPPLSAVQGDVPPAIERVVASALSLDKGARCVSAEALKLGLLEAFASGPGLAPLEQVAEYVSAIAREPLAERKRQVAEVLRARATPIDDSPTTQDASQPDDDAALPPSRDTPPPARSRRGVSDQEQDFVSLIVVERGTDDRGEQATAGAHGLRDVVIQCASDHGAEAHALGSAVVVLFRGAASSSDRALRAIGCAERLSEQLPSARVVVATGFAEHRDGQLTGATVDRACMLAASAASGIVVDDATRELTRGATSSRGAAGPPSGSIESPRSVPGVRTPYLARETELSLVEALARQVLEEQTFRSVLITAAPGVGKSRLLDEIAERSTQSGSFVVLRANGDSFASGAPFRLVRQIVRDGLRVGQADPGAAPWEADLHVREALYEILGIDQPASPLLESVRKDPRQRADFMREGFRRWFVAFTQLHPVVLLLDDLQWADAPSLRYLEDGARAELPLLIVAASRELVGESIMPWAVHHAIALGGLSRRAAERLLHDLLPKAAPAMVDRLIDRAGGNAFFLEELARWVARGGDREAMPPSAVAVAVDRFAALDPRERRFLRAASVFGEHFFIEGAQAVLGDDEDGSIETAFPLVERLRRSEVLERHASGTFRFRHAFLREAAYAALPEEERANAHGAAAVWLEEHGETDAVVLAKHHERAGDWTGWKRWVREAALVAFASSDIALLEQLSTSMVSGGATGADLGFARAMYATAAAAGARSGEALAAALDAMRLLPAGGSIWFLAVGIVMFSATADVGGGERAAPEAVRAYLDLPVEAAPPGRAHGAALVLMTVGSLALGLPAVAWQVQERGREIVAAHGDAGNFRGWVLCGERLAHRLGDVGAALRSYDEAIEIFQRTADRLGEAAGRFFRVQTRLDVGLTEGIAEDLSVHGAFAQESGFVTWVIWADLHPALAAIRRGEIAAARSGAERHASSIELYPRAIARAVLAECARLEGDAITARQLAESVLTEPFAEARSLAAHVMGWVLLAESRAVEACALAEDALREAEAAATYLWERAALRALLLTARTAAGRTYEARTAQAEALGWLEGIAASLDSIPGGRAAWLATPAVARLRAPR